MDNRKYTPGCLAGKDGEISLLPQKPVDDLYRMEDGYITRSYAHSVFKGGGQAQRWLDQVGPLFSGNASTSFGSLVDRAIPAVISGTPLSFLYAVPPEEVLSSGARRGKAYTEWKESLTHQSEISAEDMERLQFIVENTVTHPRVSEIFESTFDCQVALRHTDENGHKRKSLADGVTSDFLWDFKTTSSSWDQLWRSFLLYGYAWQASWYGAAAVDCGWPPHDMRFIVAQTVKPYAVRVYTLPQELVRAAGQEIDQTLAQIALRRALGYYRSVEDESEQEMSFPDFHMRSLSYDD